MTSKMELLLEAVLRADTQIAAEEFYFTYKMELERAFLGENDAQAKIQANLSELSSFLMANKPQTGRGSDLIMVIQDRSRNDAMAHSGNN